jgi:hypothetical protein
VRPLNLASQPFRNETLPALVFAVGSVMLVALTIQHALVIRSLLPARTSKLHREVASLEAEAERLRTEARSFTAPKPDGKVVAEWGVLKDLVDRRTFSWTVLFSRLEQVLPREVRLISIAPDVAEGQVTLDVVALARPSQAGLSLVGLLEQREEFEDVYPKSVSEQEGGGAEFHYTMRYLPAAAVAMAAATPAEAVAAPAQAETIPAQPQAAAPQPSPAPPSRRDAAPAVGEPSERDPPPATPVPLPDLTGARTLSRKPRERDH